MTLACRSWVASRWWWKSRQMQAPTDRSYEAAVTVRSITLDVWRAEELTARLLQQPHPGAVRAGV
jgi:hypothetical protein